MSLDDRVIIFGTTAAEGATTDIGVYKAGNWYSMGQLNSRRVSYGAVEHDGIVMIVGGDGIQ